MKNTETKLEGAGKVHKKTEFLDKKPLPLINLGNLGRDSIEGKLGDFNADKSYKSSATIKVAAVKQYQSF